MTNLSLINDGDYFEQNYFNLFINSEFPAYETFWIKFVAPLTNRPNDIHAKSNSELCLIGKTENDVCISQLHYSLLRHLIRAYENRIIVKQSPDTLFIVLSSLYGAQDNSFELLERFRNPSKYDPWLEKKSGSSLGGREAQREWKKFDNYPLQKIRDYRNNFVHGRLFPTIIDNDNELLPKIGRENIYFDWRIITNNSNKLPIHDFCSIQETINESWTKTLQYINNAWNKYLIPNLT